MKKPQPEYFTDDHGRHLVRLPVSGSDTPATTEAVLWENAKRRYALTGNLYATSDGKTSRRYVLASTTRGATHSTLARLLLRCPRGYHVRYNDGNSLNLLPENFRLVSTWADPSTRRDVLDLLLNAARESKGESHARV